MLKTLKYAWFITGGMHKKAEKTSEDPKKQRLDYKNGEELRKKKLCQNEN